uniref:Uncharacterized protein n=1 Tax=Phasianus colchicus TaxID=9054 RepID=A0A669PI60_PHACC
GWFLSLSLQWLHSNQHKAHQLLFLHISVLLFSLLFYSQSGIEQSFRRFNCVSGKSLFFIIFQCVQVLYHAYTETDVFVSDLAHTV